MASSNSPDSSTGAVRDHDFGSRPKEAEYQTEESGFGEEPSFQVSEQVAGGEKDTAHGATNGSLIHVPQLVGSSFKAFKPDRVEGNPNGGFSAFFDDGSSVSSPRTAGGYPIPVEQDDQTELYSEESQAYERVIRKAAIVSKNHESARLTKYLTNVNKKLDDELYEKEKMLRKLERRIKDLQLQTHLKQIDVESLRKQMADTEQENEECQLRIKHLEREVEWLKFQSGEEEKIKQRFEIPHRDSPRDQLARVEKQLETLQRKIQELEDENARKDTEISRLQEQNAVAEVEAVRLEKAKTTLIIKEKDDEIQTLVESVHQLIIERGVNQKHLHDQMSKNSKGYAHFFKERTESVAALDLEVRRLSVSMSMQSHTKGGKPESISTPVGSDLIPFDVGGRSMSIRFALGTGSGSRLSGIQESSTTRSSGIALNSYSMEIPSGDLVSLAAYFDCVDLLVGLLPLSTADAGDVRNKVSSHGTKTAVHHGFLCWQRTEVVTFQALIDITRRLEREDIVRKIEDYFQKRHEFL